MRFEADPFVLRPDRSGRTDACCAQAPFSSQLKSVARPGGFAASCGSETTLSNTNGPVMTGPVNLYLWYGGKNAQHFGGFVSQVVPHQNALSESSYMGTNTTYYQNHMLYQSYENVVGSVSMQREVVDNVSQGEGTLSDDAIFAIVQNALYGKDVDANTGARTSLPPDSNGICLVPYPLAGVRANIKYAFIGEPDVWCHDRSENFGCECGNRPHADADQQSIRRKTQRDEPRNRRGAHRPRRESARPDSTSPESARRQSSRSRSSAQPRAALLFALKRARLKQRNLILFRQ